MSDNYHYIIAGLPEIILGSDSKDISYDSLRNDIYNMCSKSDKRLIEWLEFGEKEDNLTPIFYSNAINHRNKFISEYYKLDLQIRNKKVAYIAGKRKKGLSKADNGANKNIENYAINIASEHIDESDSDIENKLSSIFEQQNIIEREIALDKFKWEKINETITFDYFNINVLLSFLAKLQIADRWNKMDKTVGKEMFGKLVNEVRGTFKGIDNNSIK